MLRVYADSSLAVEMFSEMIVLSWAMEAEAAVLMVESEMENF